MITVFSCFHTGWDTDAEDERRSSLPVAGVKSKQTVTPDSSIVQPTNDPVSHIEDSNSPRKLDTVLEESTEKTELESSGPFDVTLDDLPSTFGMESVPKNFAQFSDNATEVTERPPENISEQVERHSESEKVTQGDIHSTSLATEPAGTSQERPETDGGQLSESVDRQTPVSDGSRPEVEIILESELEQVEHIQLSLIVESDSAQDSVESESEMNAESRKGQPEFEVIVGPDLSTTLPIGEHEKEDSEIRTGSQDNQKVEIVLESSLVGPVSLTETEPGEFKARSVSRVEKSPASIQREGSPVNRTENENNSAAESSVEIPDESGDNSVFATPGVPKNTSVSDQSVSLDEDYYDSDTPNCSYHTPRSRALSPILKLSVPHGKQTPREDTREPELVDLTDSDANPEPLGTPPPPYTERVVPELVDFVGNQPDVVMIPVEDEKSGGKSSEADVVEQESSSRTTKSVAVATDFPSTEDTEDDSQSGDQETSEMETIQKEGDQLVEEEHEDEIEVMAVLPATQEAPCSSSQGDGIQQSGQSTTSSVLQPLDNDYIDGESDGYVEDSSDEECEILELRVTPSQREAKKPASQTGEANLLPDQVEPDKSESHSVEPDKSEGLSATDRPPSAVAVARLDRLEAILIAQAEALQSPSSSICAGEEPVAQGEEGEVEESTSQSNAEIPEGDSEISSSAPGPLTSSQVVSEGSFNSQQTLTSEYVEPLCTVPETATISEDSHSSTSLKAESEQHIGDSSEKSGDFPQSSSQEDKSVTEDSTSADDEASSTSGMYQIHLSDSLEYLPELPEEEEAEVIPEEQTVEEESAFEARVTESDGIVSIQQVKINRDFQLVAAVLLLATPLTILPLR